MSIISCKHGSNNPGAVEAPEVQVVRKKEIVHKPTFRVEEVEEIVRNPVFVEVDVPADVEKPTFEVRDAAAELVWRPVFKIAHSSPIVVERPLFVEKDEVEVVKRPVFEVQDEVHAASKNTSVSVAMWLTFLMSASILGLEVYQWLMR